jgi:hypothetical protein
MRLLLLALLPAACAPQSLVGGRSACPGAALLVINASRVAVEQLYLGQGGDLIGAAPLPPGQAVRIPLPEAAAGGLRLVWVDGHAAEIPGFNPCVTPRLTVEEGALQAGR